MRKTFSVNPSYRARLRRASLFHHRLLARAGSAAERSPIQADDKMRFDVTAFDAKPGQKISVTLKNIGTTPKFSMGHNFVLLDRTITPATCTQFLDPASTEAAHDYVPPGAKEVLAHTKLLGPGETDTVTFNAPYVPGHISMSARSPATTLREPRAS